MSDIPNDLVSILDLIVKHDASDLHLTVGSPPLARIHGTVIPLFQTVLDPDFCRNLVLSALTEKQRSILEETYELDYVLSIHGVGRFRANAHFSRNHIEAAFRHIPNSIPDLKNLGHRPSLERLCQLEEGLILVTGTTGSGKSTTLASMVQTISRQKTGIIITIEDPIEYIFENNLSIIKQREIGTDTKSFPTALRHILRQDPDVIVISELRDRETIQAAITAAETGHLVIGTLHTIDAPKSIDRIVDIFPGDQQNQVITQLANSLQAIVSQRLLPKSEGHGRVLATETMIANHAIRACIRDRRIHQIPGLMGLGGTDDMNTLDESLLDLVDQGLISREEALLNAQDKDYVEAETAPKKGFFG